MQVHSLLKESRPVSLSLPHTEKMHTDTPRTHTHTHTHTHTEFSSLTVSPRCITLSGMQGGGSPQQAQLNARSQERRRCCVFATRDGGREIVCVKHLDLFWHTHNYSPYLLQEQLNVASKVLRIKIVEVFPSDAD